MTQTVIDVLQSVAIFLLAGSVKKLSEAILGKQKERDKRSHVEPTKKELR